MTVKAALKSMRLRTLPLSLSGTVMGICLAASHNRTDALTILFLVLTTALLQILCNLSNELGDTLQGTDTAERQGMHYAVLDGEMTVGELKNLVKYIAVLSCISGVLMIKFSFGTLLGWMPLVFVVLGLSTVVAAMRYTLGKNPYGYRGLGDIFVFIFFGLVSTVGSYFLCCHSPELYRALLPAAAIGCFSMGVLNVNNIRDMKTDARTRITVAIKLGERRARIYQTVLIVSGWILMLLYTALTANHWTNWLYTVTLPLYVLHLKGVWTKRESALDPMLPMLVMSTFLLTIIVGIAMLCN